MNWAIVENRIEVEEEALRASVLFSFREDPGSGKMKYTKLDVCQVYKLLCGRD